MRSYSALMGYMRGLGEGLLKKAQVVSTVSGGSWFYGTYAFARGSGFSHADLLGSSSPVSHLPPQTLQDLCAPLPPQHMASRAASSLLLSDLLNMLEAEQPPQTLWSMLMGRIFLAPYGLNSSKPITQTPERGSVSPGQSLPTWVCNASLLSEKLMARRLLPILQITPDTTCVRTMLDEDTGAPRPDPAGFCVPTKNFGTRFSLRDAMGVSSSAYASSVMRMGSVLGRAFGLAAGGGGRAALKKLRKVDWQQALKELVPEYYVSSEQHAYKFGDGAFTDNTGILSLATLGARRVLAFVNTSEASSSHCAVTPDVLALFGGVSSCPAASDVADESGNTVQIFPQGALTSVLAQLAERRGGPTWFEGVLPVLPNAAYGVRGGYDMHLVLVVLADSAQWRRTLPLAIQAYLKKHVPNFPHYRTIFQNPGKLIEQTPAQIRLLCNYTEWCMNFPELRTSVDKLFS